MSSERESWIDSIKGLSIMAVLMPHCRLYDLPGKWGTLCSFGQFAIVPFFVITAYLSFASFRRFKLKGSSSIEWFIHKIIRLIPLYYLALLPAAISGGNTYWLGNETGVSFLNNISHLTFTHGFFPSYCNSIIGVEWYIGVVAIFYLFVPFLSKSVRSLKGSITLLLCSAFLITFLSGTILHLFDFNSPVYVNYWQRYSFLPEIPILSFGLCLFFAKPWLLKVKNGDCSVISWVILLSSLVLLCGQAFNKNHMYRVSDLYVCGFLFFAFMIAYYIGDFKLIKNSFWAAIGKYSYPIYLFHYWIIRLFDYLETQMSLSIQHAWPYLIIKYICVLGLSFVISMIAVKYIEKPTISFLEGSGPIKNYISRKSNKSS